MRRKFLFVLVSLMLIGASAGPVYSQGRIQASSLPPGGKLTMELVGHIGGPIDFVSAKGNAAYIDLGPELAVIDLSDPAQPKRLKSFILDNLADMAYQGNYAYAVNENGLSVFDVTNPLEPDLIGSVDTYASYYTTAIAVAGQYAYVLNDLGYISVVDISDPRNPDEVNVYFDGGHKGYQQAAIVGNFLYTITDLLTVYDLSDPIHPQPVTVPEVYAKALAVSGNYAYLVNGQNLIILNIAQPSNPIVKSNTSIINDAVIKDLAVSGNYAYVASDYQGLKVVDISDPSNPSVVRQYPSQSYQLYAVDVAVSGGLVLTAVRGGLDIASLTDPADPVSVGIFQTLASISSAKASGDDIFTAGVGLGVMDASNPANPEFFGYLPIIGSRTLTVAGQYAYITCDDGMFEAGIEIVDISDPNQPQVLGMYPAAVPEDMAVSGDYLYLPELSVVDVSDPTRPVKVGGLTIGINYDNGIAVSGHYVYAADGDQKIAVIDVSDPQHPSETATFGEAGYAHDLAIAGNYLYVVGAGLNQDLKVVDISNPAQPVEKVSINTNAPAGFVAVDGSILILSGGTSTQFYDVSDPLDPLLIASYWISAEDVSAKNGLYYASAGGDGLFIFRPKVTFSAYLPLIRR